MKKVKRGIFTNLFLIASLPIFLISFVSAQFYGRYSLSNFLNTFDAQTVTLLSIFLIVFGIIFVVLIKSIFRDYRGIAAILSFAISFLTVFELNRRGLTYNFGGLFEYVGLSADLWFIAPIIFLALMIFFIAKFGFGKVLTLFGIGLISLMAFTEGLFYEEGLVLAIGIGSLIIGAWIWKRTSGIYIPGQGYVGSAAKWAGKKSLGGAKYLAEKTWEGTAGKVIKDRVLWEQAIKENKKRDDERRRIMIHQTSKLQAIYNQHKRIYQDRTAPEPARKAAAQEMKNIMHEASRYGLNIDT